jgi:hypothetical protein
VQRQQHDRRRRVSDLNGHQVNLGEGDPMVEGERAHQPHLGRVSLSERYLNCSMAATG